MHPTGPRDQEIFTVKTTISDARFMALLLYGTKCQRRVRQMEEWGRPHQRAARELQKAATAGVIYLYHVLIS